MIRTRRRMKLCILLIVLNLAFIWINSLLPREVSSAFSKLIGMLLHPFTSGSVDLVEGQGQGTLRKIAHFAEFCSLGMLLSWLVRMLKSRKWEWFVLPISFGVIAAAVDETIQVFVPGRGPQLRDVGIDAMGVLLGVLILTGVAQWRKKFCCINHK